MKKFCCLCVSNAVRVCVQQHVVNNLLHISGALHATFFRDVFGVGGSAKSKPSDLSVMVVCFYKARSADNRARGPKRSLPDVCLAMIWLKVYVFTYEFSYKFIHLMTWQYTFIILNVYYVEMLRIFGRRQSWFGQAFPSSMPTSIREATKVKKEGGELSEHRCKLIIGPEATVCLGSWSFWLAVTSAVGMLSAMQVSPIMRWSRGCLH